MAQLDMTRGSIRQHLTRYSVPLILGNLFQLSYNMADAAIAGRFIGKAALAAEGTAGPIMNLLILGISGLSLGAGVLMSELFGAGEREKLKRELSTVLLAGLICSVTAALLGVALAGPILRWLNVPREIMDMTRSYVRIIFLGVPFTYFYNTLAAALKSVGDARTPLKFLMFSSLLNAALDVIFIGFLGFGIVCSAVTTVVAEGVSAALSMGYIYRRVPLLALKGRELRLDGALLRATLRYGSVTALQQCCQPIGKLMIQGFINALGVDAMAAFNAVTRIDDFAFTPEQSIALGITTFVAQNRGRMSREEGGARLDRIYAGFRTGLGLEVGYWAVLCVAVELLRRPIMLLFMDSSRSATAIGMGLEYLTVMGFFYILPALTNGVQGFFRGCGRMRVTLVSTLIQISCRVLFTWQLAPRMGIMAVALGSAVGWTLMLGFEVPWYFFCKRRPGRMGLDGRD